MIAILFSILCLTLSVLATLLCVATKRDNDQLVIENESLFKANLKLSLDNEKLKESYESKKK